MYRATRSCPGSHTTNDVLHSPPVLELSCARWTAQLAGLAAHAPLPGFDQWGWARRSGPVSAPSLAAVWRLQRREHPDSQGLCSSSSTEYGAQAPHANPNRRCLGAVMPFDLIAAALLNRAWRLKWEQRRACSLIRLQSSCPSCPYRLGENSLPNRDKEQFI